jgi:glycosyltransferase involved in cell wall biosynthesis
VRVAIDAHAIGKRQTGNEVYVRSLLGELVELAPEIQYTAYVSSREAIAMVPPSVGTRLISPNPYRRLGYQFGFLLRSERPDVLHVQYTAPLHCATPVVVTVHDVSFVDHPEFFSRFRQQQLSLTVKRTIRQAARVLTCSEFSRQAIARAYDLDPAKISVVPNAASAAFYPRDRDEAAAIVRQRFGFTQPYLLCVGNLQRRKNQIGLIRAFAALMKAHPELPHHLVCVGKETPQANEIYTVARNSGIQERIHFTGFVSDEVLPWLYSGSDLFIFPSFYEGFGIPLLEAMACGCLVASSNRTAMPEVAGNAAIYFDPSSVDGIAKTIYDMLTNLAHSQSLVEASLERARRYSWTHSAEIVLNAYREAAGKPLPASVEPAARAFASRP